MSINICIGDDKSSLILNKVEFKEVDGINYFRVFNDKGDDVNFIYASKTYSLWVKERFEIYLLENPYLNAENDVFEIYEETLNERLGWIFPIEILETEDTNRKNLDQYKFIAFHKLLEREIQISSEEINREFLNISDFYKDAIVCIISKDAIDKIPGFSFENYILDLYSYEYLLYNSSSRACPIYDQSAFVNMMREGRIRITLRKSKFGVVSNDFTKALFIEHLLQSESFIVRFILLYQLIEHFIQLEFDNMFQYNLDLYQQGKLPKNDFKENIINSSKERELIKIVLNSTAIDTDLKREFVEESDLLFSELNILTKESFPDKVYDIRNLVTHRLRDLTYKSERVKEICRIFQRIILELLINHK